MIFICKDGERECPPDWIQAWTDERIGVPEKLIDLQGYCRDDGRKRPTKRGLRAFLGNVLRKDCPLRKTLAPIVQEIKPNVPREAIGGFIQQMRAKL